MSSRRQKSDDLASAVKRIVEGEGYIQRMEELVARAIERGEPADDLQKYLAEMRAVASRTTGTAWSAST